ncbi:competence type IV pilus minor pilin ComGF [Planococcus sp. 107-1]|uniref:competence type IV pilus minor pilin ComGF n=1 Tax=Planococcus sp. 107-1 TaxID=2908840 RepID=UPI001F19535B|nr:competence type IV pilus minor pilin ComGF [Planococcus sp. 107-1]UJF28321.1 ComGF family competence protein [Planococcus sp. 107-1]
MLKLNPFNENGFTFLGSLFELIILMAFLPLIVIFFSLMIAFEKETDAGNAEWHLFSYELQSYLTKVDSIEVINNGSGIRVIQDEVEYDIELYGNLIRKQKFRQGHEVMATKLDSCSFQIEGTILTIFAEFANGRSMEAEYVYTYAEK